MAPSLLKPAEAARLLNVDPRTLVNWTKAGRLNAIRTPGGHRRYPEAQVRSIIAPLDDLASLMRAVELEFPGWQVRSAAYGGIAATPGTRPGLTLYAPDPWQMRDAIAAQITEWSA